jgi:hypothetical protein
MTWRTKDGSIFVRANREKVLLSHIWNFALWDPAGDVRAAHRQLGYSSTAMTEYYTRDRRGAKFTPTR